VYTIGHSNVPAQKIVDLLKAYQIDVLVDVRSTPYSRFAPQFNREPFAETLRGSGITYKYAGEYLGGRPKDPTCYKSGEEPTKNTEYLKLVDYAEVARRPWYQQGIAHLVDIASRQRTAIMCSEEDPHQCHRHHLIAQTLLTMGIIVRHIRGQGTVEEATLEEKTQAEPQPLQMTLFDMGSGQ